MLVSKRMLRTVTSFNVGQVSNRMDRQRRVRREMLNV
jgi:hypothetical protein